MNEPTSSPFAVRLARAVRFALVSLVVGTSYLTLRASLGIETAQRLGQDLLGAKTLPPLTLFLFSVRTEVMVVSGLIPAMALAMFFNRHLISAIYILGALWLLNVALAIFIFHAMLAPLLAIMAGMQGG